MKSTAKCYPELRETIETIPIIECHDHSGKERIKYTDAILALTSGDFHDDITSAIGEADCMVMKEFYEEVE